MTLLEHYDDECLRVSVQYGVLVADIKGRCRKRRLAEARTLVAFAMRRHSPNSLIAIARIMGVEHTSVLRMLKKSEAESARWLLHQMTAEEAEAAKAYEVEERARIEAERASLDEAASKVAVLGQQADIVERAMADKNEWKRRWGLAIYKARQAEDADAMLRLHLKDLFPLTHQTPSALCGA